MTARTDALQEVLAALHAVVYGYGVAGARLTGADRARAHRLRDAHRAQRDALAATLRELGTDPMQTAAAYALPRPVETAEDARVLATLLEEGLAAAWADAVLRLPEAHRSLAVTGLRDAAVAAARWRGGSVPFPGLPERAG